MAVFLKFFAQNLWGKNLGYDTTEFYEVFLCGNTRHWGAQWLGRECGLGWVTRCELGHALFIATFSAGCWSPQKVVKSTGILPKMTETFMLRIYSLINWPDEVKLAMASGSFCLIYLIWCVCCLKKVAGISCSPLFGEDYLPWAPLFGEDYLPWAPETIEHEGFGHLKTRWFTPKKWRFWRPMVCRLIFVEDGWLKIPRRRRVVDRWFKRRIDQNSKL